MDNPPKDNAAKKPGEEKWRLRLARDLAEHIADRKQTWGDTDEVMIARYVSGMSSEEEKARVEKAMKEYGEA